MKPIFQCWDCGVDGRDRSIVGYVSNMHLAEKVVLGRGASGFGNGTIASIDLWENAEDLPGHITERITREASRLNSEVDKHVSELARLLEDVPEPIRAGAIQKLQGALTKT